MRSTSRTFLKVIAATIGKHWPKRSLETKIQNQNNSKPSKKSTNKYGGTPNYKLICRPILKNNYTNM